MKFCRYNLHNKIEVDEGKVGEMVLEYISDREKACMATSGMFYVNAVL